MLGSLRLTPGLRVPIPAPPPSLLCTPQMLVMNRHQEPPCLPVRRGSRMETQVKRPIRWYVRRVILCLSSQFTVETYCNNITLCFICNYKEELFVRISPLSSGKDGVPMMDWNIFNVMQPSTLVFFYLVLQQTNFTKDYREADKLFSKHCNLLYNSANTVNVQSKVEAVCHCVVLPSV